MNRLLLETEAGFWNPLLWVAVFAIATLIVYLIRRRGVKSYGRRTEQTLPFFSGNVAPGQNVKPGNLYWGFFTAMEEYYNWMKGIHTGVVNDYVYAFVFLTVVLAALVIGVFLWA